MDVFSLKAKMNVLTGKMSKIILESHFKPLSGGEEKASKPVLPQLKSRF